MKSQKTLMSSDRMDWGTPQALFDFLDAIFNFDLDVCATWKNTMVKGSYYSIEDDALQMEWKGKMAWMNPPYGREIMDWIAHAHDQSESVPVAVLVPSRTDTKWFQYMWHADALLFVKGRLKFRGAKSSAPFPSVIAIFGRGLSRKEIDKLETIGKVVIP